MERKRELTGVDLVALVGELRGRVGAVVDKAYLYGEDLVRLKMREGGERLELLIEVGETKRVHPARPEHVPDAPERPPDFARKLRERVSGANLAVVRQHGFDRVLVFEFRRQDGDTTLVVELFGDGNVAVLDESGSVVDCLETVRLKSRTVAPGARYEFPTERPDPDDLSRTAFEDALLDSDTDAVRTLATQLDFGGLWAEELCTRAGVEKTKDVDGLTDEDLDALYAAVGRVFDALETPDPRVYYRDGNRVDATPLPMEEYADVESEAFDSFVAALDDYFTNAGVEKAEAAEDDSAPDFAAEIEKQERIIAQQENAIEEFDEQAGREREKAELLYAEYDLVDEITETVREARESGHGWDAIEQRFAEGRERGIPAAEAVEGVDPEAGTVAVRLDGHIIDLDPREGVEQNADRLYTEAKRIEEKKEGAEEAIAETRADLERLETRREQWTAADESDDETADADVDWLSRPSVPIRRSEQWYERFRWFRTSDGFLVIGGRNADQNEEVVGKYMDPYDRFLHAQAHGGPATVLKTSAPSEPSTETDVPDRSIEEAAQFAVSYSSVWKDGRFAGDVYVVDPDQVSQTAESGEYLKKGGFAIRGDRTYLRDTAVGAAVGVACEPETRVLGGPPSAIEEQTETHVKVEPGRYAQGDVAKRIYREFRERFTDTSMVRKVASPDRIQHFLPPGTSRIAEE